jgi:hypothetical protein
MNLYTENKIWIESSSSLLGVRPEALLNAILRQVRTNLGLLESPMTLEDWLQRSTNLEQSLKSNVEDSKKTLRTLQETLKATQLYLNQIQGTQIDIPPPQDRTTEAKEIKSSEPMQPMQPMQPIIVANTADNNDN